MENNFTELKIVFKLFDDTSDEAFAQFDRTILDVKNIVEQSVSFCQLQPSKVISEESEQDPRTEYSIYVHPDSDQIKLLEVLFNISKLLEQKWNAKPGAFYYSIVLPENEDVRFLKATHSSHECDIKLGAFSLGNVFEHRQFNEHLEVLEMGGEIERLKKNFMEEKYKRKDWDRAFDLYPTTSNLPMSVEFEHDRQRLAVKFLNPTTNELGQPVIDHVKLVIQYAAIKQIYWQMTNAQNGRAAISHRLYFRILHPPTVLKIGDFFNMGDKPKQDNRGKGNGNTKSAAVQSEERCYSWTNKGNDNKAVRDSPILMLNFEIENYSLNTFMLNLLGRLQSIIKIPVEIRNFKTEEAPILPEIKLDDRFYADFDLMYSLEALTNTCGNIVTDHFVDFRSRKKFFSQVRRLVKTNRRIALDSLEKLVEDLSDRKEVPIGGLNRLFQRIVRCIEQSPTDLDSDSEWRQNQGYVYIRRVTITPTRLIYGRREMLMGNRVLRFDPVNFPPENFIRVIFRDENYDRVYRGKVPTSMINEFVGNTIKAGFVVADRAFYCLGSSNSQMRDGGSYFVKIDGNASGYNGEDGYAPYDILNDFRKRLGQFSTTSIPKMISRLGQCFTQAQETTISISSQLLIHDFEGGIDRNKKPYIFSDGCGSLSMAATRIIARDLELDPDNPPSCFQVRYAGYKGVLAPNPEQDEAIEWFVQNPPCDCYVFHDGEDRTTRVKKFGECSPCEHAKEAGIAHFHFRDSQLKFDVNEEQKLRCKLEIVKYAAPSPVNLNRQLINIIAQVSQNQSRTSHEAITLRLHSLLDLHINEICLSLTDEHKARQKIEEFPRYIQYARLNSFALVDEPFFRLMLRASARVAMHKLGQKTNIRIPSNLARMMFGVIDTTGQLQYGQVFFQYTNNLHDANPNMDGRFSVHTGPVMITKNPCIVSGDVRMFEAVDVPELHHLVNVLVFPRYGPRPHSDEMAGSDLDGDEYVVIWDTELFLDKTQPAFDYTPSSVVSNIAVEIQNDPHPYSLQCKMAEFMVKYLAQDSIGRIANAHLINSDLYGLETKVSFDIARKHSQAVDFPKTGNAPMNLTNSWSYDNPPERVERAPDFMDKDEIEPQYISGRLNGHLFRRIREVSDCISTALAGEGDILPTVDDLKIFQRFSDKDWWNGEEGKQLLEKAGILYQRYANTLERLINFYGIESEGELYAATFSAMRNRISDRENDDMSFFNTTRVIEQRMKDIVSKTRSSFFEEFGGIEACTDHFGVCRRPTEAMKRFASACYLQAYDHTVTTKKKLISFPWVTCWDVINTIHQENSCRPDPQGLFHFRMFDPFGLSISEYIDKYIKHQMAVFDKFKNFLLSTSEHISLYVYKYPGLDKFMFIATCWARKHGLIGTGPFTDEHIWMLILMHGLRVLPQHSVVDTSPQWIQSLSDAGPDEHTINHPRDVSKGTGKLGRKFVTFLQYLGSRDFKFLKSLDFSPMGSRSYFFNQEWLLIHKAAIKTYHNLVFASAFDDQKGMSMLPSLITTESDQLVMNGIKPVEAVFVAEIPGYQEILDKLTGTDDVSNRLKQRLCEQLGCDTINIRLNPHSKLMASIWNKQAKANSNNSSSSIPQSIRLIVNCWGSHEAIDSLRHIFAVSPCVDLEEESRRERAQLIPIQILERLGEIVPEISDLVKICGDRDTSFGFLKAAAADNSRRPRGAYTGGAGDGMAQKLADWLGALSLN